MICKNFWLFILAVGMSVIALPSMSSGAVLHCNVNVKHSSTALLVGGHQFSYGLFCNEEGQIGEVFYQVDLETIGPGIEIGFNYLLIACPLHQRPKGVFVAAALRGGAGVHLSGAAFVGGSGRPCFMTGAGYGVGAHAGIGRMRITPFFLKNGHSPFSEAWVEDENEAKNAPSPPARSRTVYYEDPR